MTIDYDKIRRNAAKLGRDALVTKYGMTAMMNWKYLQTATDAAISFYNASIEDVSALLMHPSDEVAQLRAERVQLQAENESLRADLLATKRTVDTLLDDVKAEIDTLLDDVKAENPTARDKTDIEVLAERLTKVEDRLADIASEIGRAHARLDQQKENDLYLDQRIDRLEKRLTDVTDTIGQRITELVTALEREREIARKMDVVAEDRLARVHTRIDDLRSVVGADQSEESEPTLHTSIRLLNRRITEVADTIGQRITELVEKTGGTIPGYPLTARTTSFGRGDVVRLDMAQTQGGRRIFGWYTVEAIRTDISGYTVQVSAPEKADPKPLFWIKPEDVLEVRKPGHSFAGAGDAG